MPSTVHIVETALLIFVAFLCGCVIGHVARRLTRPRAAAGIAETPTVVATGGPDLVVAPTIAPIARPGPSAAERLAAAAAGSAGKTDAAADAEVAAAADVAAPSPSSLDAAIPLVEPEKATGPVNVADIPPIDEAVHVVGGGPATEGVAEAIAASATDPERSADGGAEAVEKATATPIEEANGAEDAEAEAMRAIEGGWTPRTSVQRTQPAPAPELSPEEIEAAMEAARLAVARAAAAAESAVGDASIPPAAAPAELAFETAGSEDTALENFLEGKASVPSPDGMDFEAARETPPAAARPAGTKDEPA